jgi:hypothetical protein
MISDAELDVALRDDQLAVLTGETRQLLLGRLRLDAAGVLRLYGKRGELLVVPLPTLDGLIEAVQADQRHHGYPTGQ